MFLGFLWKNVSPFSQEQFFFPKKNFQSAATEYIHRDIYLYKMILFVPIPFWASRVHHFSDIKDRVFVSWPVTKISQQKV